MTTTSPASGSTKISALGAAIALGGPEIFPATQNSVTKGVTASQIAVFAALELGVVTAYSIGCKCDGSTDDWAALNAYITGNSNVTILFPAGTTTIVSQAVPWRNALALVCLGGFATIKASAASTDNVIGNISGAYSGVVTSNIIVDGNRAACAYNTRNAGATDDQYQNGIRLFQITNGVFMNTRVQNSVMNGWSLYAAQDNTFVTPWATNIGKSTSIVSGSASYAGAYLEYASSRNRLICPHIDTTRGSGIWENGGGDSGGVTTDNTYIDVYVNAPSSDGFQIGPGAGNVPCSLRPRILGLTVIGANQAGAVGLRGDCNNIADTINELYATGVSVRSSTNGIVLGGTGAVNYAKLIGVDIQGSTTNNINLSAQTTGCYVSGRSTTGGSTDYLDTGTANEFDLLVSSNVRRMKLGGLPTSSSGVSSGELYYNSSVLTKV